MFMIVKDLIINILIKKIFIMKNFIILTLILVLSGFTSFAQDDLSNYSFNPEVKKMDRLMSKGQKNCYSVTIDGVSKKEIEKSWGKYVKDHGAKPKWDKKKNEYFADNAKISSVSDNTIDVYSQLIESDNRVELIVWMDLGGSFLSNQDHAEQSVHGEAFVLGFATNMERKRVDTFRKKQEDTLGDMQDDLKDMEKDKSKLEKSIEEYQKKIEEAKMKIEENVVNQGKKAEEIKKQEIYVNKVKEIKSTLGN